MFFVDFESAGVGLLLFFLCLFLCVMRFLICSVRLVMKFFFAFEDDFFRYPYNHSVEMELKE